MAGEIAAAYLAILPSMRGFGTGIVQQGGPQIAMAGRQLGQQGGVALGAALGGSAAKSALPAIGQVNSAIAVAQASTQGWLGHTAAMAVKNVTLYGSMYAAIQGVHQGVDAMFEAMVGFNAELEQSEIGFTTLLGSSAAAREQMTWIKDFAKETPFGYQDLVSYSQQLLALGFNGEQAKDVLEATGDAAAALGRGSESIARINLALGQMWTKGKVQSQEMLQLTEAGIGGWQILADKYGASVAEVQDRVTRGLISAKEAVPALLEGMEAQFGGLMEAQSKTFSGVVSNIQDTLQQEFAEAGEPLFRELQTQAQALLDSLDDPEVVEMIGQLGDGLATGARALSDFLRFAWEWRDVILAVGVGYTALRVAMSQADRAAAGGGIIAQVNAWRDVPAALAGVRSATAAATAANKDALRASLNLGAAQQAEAQARVAAAEAAARATDATTRGTDASRASWAAQRNLADASRARMAANAELIASENAATAATERATVAVEARRAAWARLAPVLSTVGAMAGSVLLFDGWSRSAQTATDDAENLGASVAGMAEAMAGGALAGAALGTIIPGLGTAVGAAGGAVVGLVGNLWSMQAAMDAANADVSAIKDALVEMGVEARIAELATSGLTNEQLAAAGGFDAIAAAMRAGTYNEYVLGLQSQSDAIHEQIDALEKQRAAMAEAAADGGRAGAQALAISSDYEELAGRINALTGEANQLDGAMSTLGVNSDYLSQAQEQITYNAYQAAFAMDMQTGALGRTTEAAWQAIVAEGGLGQEALQAAIRMEGLAGVAGFATQMIAGIPKGTAINFSTNAADITNQIVTLIAARDAVMASQGDNSSGRTVAIEARIRALRSQLAQSLTSGPSILSLPSVGGGRSSGGRAASPAVNAAKRAAEEAARQLKQDRQAQLRFADAFGSLMQAALEGNFDQYRDRLQDQITSLTRDGYKKAAAALKQQSGALTRAALDYAALTNKLEKAGDAYDDLTGRMLDQYNMSRDLITGLGKVTDAQSFDQLTYLLGETTTAATQYQDVLKSLKEQGLSEDLWNQLAQAGPESMGLAQSILLQGQEGIDQLNTLSGGLLDAADSMGELVSQSMYQQGVDAMRAYIDGLESESSALEAQLETIGNNILKKTAGAITPGNAGYSAISSKPQTIANTYNLSISAESLGDIKSVQDFIRLLEQAPTSQLVNQAGTVTS